MLKTFLIFAVLLIAVVLAMQPPSVVDTANDAHDGKHTTAAQSKKIDDEVRKHARRHGGAAAAGTSHRHKKLDAAQPKPLNENIPAAETHIPKRHKVRKIVSDENNNKNHKKSRKTHNGRNSQRVPQVQVHEQEQSQSKKHQQRGVEHKRMHHKKRHTVRHH